MSGYHAKKRLGQNFLKSESVIHRIIEAINPQPDSIIIEIGAGRGALTLPLAQSDGQLIAVEFDADLIGYLRKLLKKYDNAEIINKDFLAYEPTVKNYILVGNLPYNITSPVIEYACRRVNDIKRAYFMTQKEVALRIASKPGTKDWSPLAIFSQINFDINILFDISPKHFSPPPKVTSSLIELIPQAVHKIAHPELFEKLVRRSFMQRRKTCINNLIQDIIPNLKQATEIFEICDLPLQSRAEEISTEKFLTLTNLLVARKILT